MAATLEGSRGRRFISLPRTCPGAAWKREGIRPPVGDPHPDRTNPDFCEYDEPTKSYRYTRAYVNYLVKKCGTAEGFEAVTGIPPRLKPGWGEGTGSS
jgi:hypothetical protein